MKKKTVFLLLCLVITLPFASAWGVAYATNHFTLQPGDEIEVDFTLQNYVGDDVKRIIVRFTGDKEIATIVDPQEYYLLPPKTKDYPLTVKLQIPEPAKRHYEVKVEFITYYGERNVGFATAKVIPLIVDVPEGTEPASTNATPEADLTETYKEIEKEIGEREEITDSKITGASGLEVLDDKKRVSVAWLYLIILLLIPFVFLIVGQGVKKKRKRELGL